MEHSDHWIATGWHGEQWDFQYNEKTMEHANHWIMTGWHGEQWDFQYNEKTMEHSDHWIMTGSWLDDMELFKTMKRFWKDDEYLISESWLHASEYPDTTQSKVECCSYISIVQRRITLTYWYKLFCESCPFLCLCSSLVYNNGKTFRLYCVDN